jgi:iron complex transport system permease protein
VTTVRRRNSQAALVGLSVALGIAILAALCLGAVRIPLAETFHILLAKVTGHVSADSRFEAVVWQLRAPRVALGLLVGATLSVAGALMQGLFRNPLADPGLIGVSSGAALGAVTVIVLGGALFPAWTFLTDTRFLPVAAFIGALAVTFFIQRLADTGGYTAVATLLLAGVAINALVDAVIGLSTFLATDVQLRTLSFWTLGSLGAANWSTVALAAPFCLGMVALAPCFAGLLNALALGEAEAAHLGFSIERSKRLLILLTAAGVGTCVAFTGMIGFVGLVVPHLVRLWIGPDHRWLLPASALLGGVLLLAADTVARVIVAPAELPIGILTAAFGGPFFLFMLLRQRHRALWS